MYSTKSYAAYNDKDELKSYEFNRREVGPKDIEIDILYCGVCHSDIHMVRNDWGMSAYPLVPGHEIIGRVKKLGADAQGFSEGQLVGVGCMVDSCRKCEPCKQDVEQHCDKGMVMTYGSPDSHNADAITQGGYSTRIVVDQDFVLKVSENLDSKSVAPLLCAGITTYSPLRQWNVKSGDKVGVIGLGGLGHMGVKLASAMGAHVVMITTSPEKGEDAKRLGASDVLVSKNEEQMSAHVGTFDFLLNTIPVAHNIDPYVPLLKLGKTMAVVGATPIELNTMGLVFGRKIIAGSLIGGIKETQEMLDFCAEHNIVSDVETIDIEDINTAYERVMKSDVKYRFVIDMKSMK
ncbi:NAD(P)-dependent alcohol dehydrogenase [Piscirickettsia salmonis]|uniref:NAD(P)-dependent alcohol dehydrogenase n=1 Tax=Piscirickettsia salmonis TaxID=1238 RepID=UPI000300CAE6|nr:NAD(P)-dependent alcohol dehydrogenase [Piscirickettsia salmonis]AMA43907.1 hydroxyacid dehydrogenase [Piscirickettsia salmonis]AOS37125.1 hydroxyacid dehydrogenase [Piscirickettsia salmonis]APS62076.1 hydroxyacid dehydrogenase [Piscirickettsia salmonis]APS65326.1 hydroxyacid dehydrogenase [Piscirickettsia salmonis]APS68679.1 hydroxyacid dehydrogenase [Piscirickettsia salmonis]